MGLVRHHALERIHPFGGLRQPVVTLGQLGGSKVGPGRVQLGAGRFNVVDHIHVRLACSFLEVAHEAMHGRRVDDVHREESGYHHHLSTNHHHASDKVGLEHVQAQEQVHTLILGLLEESGDPSMITLHGAERTEVAQTGSHEAGDSGNAFEHNKTPLDGFDTGIDSSVASDEVEGVVQSIHETVDNSVAEILGLVVVEDGQFIAELLLSPDVILLATNMVSLLLVVILGRLQRMWCRGTTEVDSRLLM